MNNAFSHQDYGFKNQQSMKFSFVCQPDSYKHQVYVIQRPTVLRRSSNTPNHSNRTFDSSEYLRNSMASLKDVLNSRNESYYHQSNCQANQPQISEPFIRHQEDKKPETSSNGLKDTLLNIDLEQKIRIICEKLELTATLVDKHEKVLKTEGFDHESNYWKNNMGIKNVIEEQVTDLLRFKERDWTIHNNLVRGQIESMRHIIKEIPLKSQINNQMKVMESNISNVISQVTKNIVAQITQMTKFHENESKEMSEKFEKKFKELKINLEEKFKAWEQSKKEQDTESSTASYQSQSPFQQTVSMQNRRSFIGDGILLKLTTKFSVESDKKQIKIEECEDLYKIDSEGFLLDWENKYIINQDNQKIRLTQKQIQKLKAMNILTCI